MLKDTQQQKQLKILLIGDSCEDVYVFGKCSRISSEAPVPILSIEMSETRPGMCLNVKKNLENLGNVVDCITHTEKIIKKRFVDTPSMSHLLRVDKESKIKSLKKSKIESINFKEYACVVISDYNKGFIKKDTALLLAKKCKESNIALFVDSKKTDLSCYENAVIKLNSHERILVKKLPRNYELIETLGKSGAEFRGKTYKAYESKTKSINKRDVCGAGDTFMSGLVHHYVNISKDISEAIRFGNKCAGVVVEKFGTTQISTQLLSLEDD